MKKVAFAILLCVLVFLLVVPAISADSGTPGYPYVVKYADTLWSIARRTGTTVQQLVQVNSLPSQNWIYVGQVLWIPKSLGPAPTFTRPIPQLHLTERIEVNLHDQTIKAFEDGQVVKFARVSTGVIQHPTPIGKFWIGVKVLSQTMTGGRPGIDYYSLPEVPNVMYLENEQISVHAGYALHGTYWHNNFGHPMSHGCVNLTLSDAKWFYDWAEVGTEVDIIP